jgi:hypothetical protein
MSHVASFQIKEDDATGEIGFIPKDCEDFNAVTNGSFLFHDVFEHWFENKSRWFSGDDALTPAGEVAAQGARIYYLWTLGFNPIARNADEYGAICNQCIGDILESNFGEFTSSLPWQRPVECSYVDDIAETIHARVRKGSSLEWLRENQMSKPKRQDIVNCLRWGWKMASKVIPNPDTWDKRRQNRMVCEKFVEFWDKFFSQYKGELSFMSNRFRQIDIHVGRKDEVVHWNAVFIGRHPFKDVTLRADSNIYDKFELSERELEYA